MSPQQQTTNNNFDVIGNSLKELVRAAGLGENIQDINSEIIKDLLRIDNTVFVESTNISKGAWISIFVSAVVGSVGLKKIEASEEAADAFESALKSLAKYEIKISSDDPIYWIGEQFLFDRYRKLGDKDALDQWKRIRLGKEDHGDLITGLKKGINEISGATQVKEKNITNIRMEMESYVDEKVSENIRSGVVPDNYGIVDVRSLNKSKPEAAESFATAIRDSKQDIIDAGAQTLAWTQFMVISKEIFEIYMTHQEIKEAKQKVESENTALENIINENMGMIKQSFQRVFDLTNKILNEELDQTELEILELRRETIVQRLDQVISQYYQELQFLIANIEREAVSAKDIQGQGVARAIYNISFGVYNIYSAYRSPASAPYKMTNGAFGFGQAACGVYNGYQAYQCIEILDKLNSKMVDTRKKSEVIRYIKSSYAGYLEQDDAKLT